MAPTMTRMEYARRKAAEARSQERAAEARSDSADEGNESPFVAASRAAPPMDAAAKRAARIITDSGSEDNDSDRVDYEESTGEAATPEAPSAGSDAEDLTQMPTPKPEGVDAERGAAGDRARTSSVGTGQAQPSCQRFEP
jgi:hypothetical protein